MESPECRLLPVCSLLAIGCTRRAGLTSSAPKALECASEPRVAVANHKQAEKRNRQRLKRRARNLTHLSSMRTFMKRVRRALDGGDGDAAKASLPAAVTAITKAASKGVIHRNTASRYVSRLTKAVAVKPA